MKLLKLLTWTAVISLVFYLLPDDEESDKDLKKKLDVLTKKFTGLIEKSKKLVDKETLTKVNQEFYKIKNLFKNININNLRNSLAKTMNSVAKHLSVVEDSIRNDKNNIDVKTTSKPKKNPNMKNVVNQKTKRTIKKTN